VLGRVDFERLRALWKEPGPQPVDVINLITMRESFWYRVYAFFVVPMIFFVGGGIPFASRHAGAIHGEPRASELLVVRYPSIRHFLFMTSNPFYLFVNLFRQQGVERFEASFCEMDHADSIAGHPVTVAVHYNGDAARDAEMREALDALGGERFYGCREHSEFFLSEYRPTDPNPMRFKALALVAFDDHDAARAAFSAEQLERLGAIADELSVQLYDELDWRNPRPEAGD